MSSPTSSKYHFCLVDSEGGAPSWISSDDLEGLCKSAYERLSASKEGWAYFIIDGKRCLVSQPRQVFLVQLPDGSTKTLSSAEGPVYNNDGKFISLRPAMVNDA